MGLYVPHQLKGIRSGDTEETETMQLHLHPQRLSAMRAFSTPMRCPHCSDWMVAPISSEFVEGGEIRHHWECEACGEFSSTTYLLTSE